MSKGTDVTGTRKANTNTTRWAATGKSIDQLEGRRGRRLEGGVTSLEGEELVGDGVTVADAPDCLSLVYRGHWPTAQPAS